MGMAMKADETFMYVLTADPATRASRISFFEPKYGTHHTSYFMIGANLYNGDNSFSYHVKSHNLNSNSELLFITGL